MWRKRRSALFIDFENVGSRVSPDAIAALLQWLEEGKFDEAGGKRRLVAKKVYWNSSAEKHRALFEAAGFDVVLCQKFSTMKNGADIRMALDIIDTCWEHKAIKEFILFTTDSDFVPVLQRLSDKSKLSVILVDEQKSSSHTAFDIFADVLVPMRQMTTEGLNYRPQKKGLLANWRQRKGNSAAPKPINGAAPAERADTAGDQDMLAQAERAVIRITSRTPKKFTPRKKIEWQLKEIRGFKKTGADAYLGQNNYQALMIALGRRNTQIKVQQGKALSASVMWVPED